MKTNILCVTLLATLFILMLSCKKNGSPVTTTCDKVAVYDPELYPNVKTDNYNIVNAIINGDCLEITFGSSGCSGSTWVTELIGVRSDAAVEPPTQMAKLKLTNNELCTAAFSKTVSFNLTPLRVENRNKVTIQLDKWNKSLTYNY